MLKNLKNKFFSSLAHYLGMIDEPLYSYLNNCIKNLILIIHRERIIHLGSKHRDKTFYIIQDLPPSAGLASWHDRVVGYLMRAEQKGWTPVIKPPPPAQTDSGDWYDYFKPVSDVSITDAMQGANVVFATTLPMIHKRYNPKNIARRNRTAAKIRLNDTAQKFIDQNLPKLKEKFSGPIVGIRFRGTDYRTSGSYKPIGHASVPDVDLFCQTVVDDMNRWNIPVGKGEHIYVMTEEQEALKAIQQHFPSCHFVEKERFENFDFSKNKYLCYHRLPNTTPYENNLFYLLETYMLASCDYLIGTHNGAVLMACNLNGNQYKDVHILKTGVT